MTNPLFSTAAHDFLAKLAAVVLTMSIAAGCAGVRPPLESDLESPEAAIRDCARWFARLDEAVDRAGVRDAGDYRIPGFPYLRADRFAASFGSTVREDPAAFAVWVNRLRDLDATARAYELQNLPAASLAALDIPDKHAAETRSDGCAAELRRADLASGPQIAELIARSAVPDDYLDGNRVLGLYPITGIPFSFGVERWHEETVAMFRRAGTSANGEDALVRYEPAGQPEDAVQARATLTRAPTDLLGIPRLSRENRDRLLRAFAPIFEIDTSGIYDRFGPLAWGAGPAPEVDMSHPVAYRRLALTRYRGGILAQLVYTIWFPERPQNGAFDLQAGRLDGIVFRITLDREGRPLVYDSIHPCGCYHMFFPTARVATTPSPEAGTEWAFVPLTLPPADPSRRITVTVASGSHYITGLRFDTGGRGTPYQLADDDALRVLPTLDGGTRSAFGPDGIVPGTERLERFFLWPTGVESPGAMRQWGKQATAFLGRRHFDDADLIERRFSTIEPPSSPVSGSPRSMTRREPLLGAPGG